MMLVVEEFEQNSKYFYSINKRNLEFDETNENKLQQMLSLKNDNKILNSEIKQLRKEIDYLNSKLFQYQNIKKNNLADMCY